MTTRAPDDVLGLRASAWWLGGLIAALVVLTAVLASAWHPVEAVDHAVARWGYSLTYRHGLRASLWRTVAVVGQPMVLRVLLVLTGVVQLLRGRRALGVWLIAVPVAENVIAPFSKYLLNRPRPHWLHPIAVEHSTSYPSGHAAGAGMFACAVALFALTTARGRAVRWTLIIGAVAVAVVISVDRIFLGVHYLSDVVGGNLLGVAITVAGWLVLLLVQRRRGAARTPTAPRR
jgi:membrane-associated phospholipid phosphatase